MGRRPISNRCHHRKQLSGPDKARRPARMQRPVACTERRGAWKDRRLFSLLAPLSGGRCGHGGTRLVFGAASRHSPRATGRWMPRLDVPAINDVVGDAAEARTNRTLEVLQAIIGADAGNRGMTHLIVPGDFVRAARILATQHHLEEQNAPAVSATPPSSAPPPSTDPGTVVVLSGFPCCVAADPPTETDGPPGACAVARAALALGRRVLLVTDDCNAAVFRAAARPLRDQYAEEQFSLRSFPARLSEADAARLRALRWTERAVVVAIERAGPAADGACYTMRGIDMAPLVAPLHWVVQDRGEATPFIAVGDGGNELGMGKVIDRVRRYIPNGDKVGCVVSADHLIATSVSNWGGYALAAGAALVRAELELAWLGAGDEDREVIVRKWIDRCLPTEAEEVELIDRCVRAGCRDGVTGKMEATVDGMPLETSLQCIRDIRNAALAEFRCQSSNNATNATNNL